MRVGNYMYAGGIVNIVKQPNFPTDNVFSNIFRFNPGTGVIDTAFKPQLLGKDGTRESGEVYALETSSDGKSLYIGGRFTSVGGAPVTGIVKWNLVTNTRDTSFNPRLTLGVNRPATVYDLKMLNGRLFVASDATHIEVNGTKVNGSALMAIHP
ncbi:hypothetical protein IPL68_06040 [Candidatus Saccharibacteria bacterium]|nr:MAG: hypothetical protein IPL68_06040 [Candidatus Saccharibacteria bacterium]